MRRFTTALIACTLVVGVATPVLAAPPCKDAKGKFIKCPPPPAAATRCKDSKGKFVKCGTPGARPVK